MTDTGNPISTMSGGTYDQAISDRHQTAWPLSKAETVVLHKQLMHGPDTIWKFKCTVKYVFCRLLTVFRVVNFAVFKSSLHSTTS